MPSVLSLCHVERSLLLLEQPLHLPRYKTFKTMFYHELAYRPVFSNVHRANRRPSTSNLAAVNVRETETHYELHLMAPGRVKEDFKISLSPEKALLISYEAPEQNAEWMHQEYRLQSFKRSVRLSENVDASNISATYENGILVVRIPKVEEAAQTALEIPVQ